MMRYSFAALALALALVSSPATAQTGPGAYTSSSRYDDAGRVTGTISPDPTATDPHPYLAVRNTYDGAGRLTKVEEGALTTWFGPQTKPINWTGFTVFRSTETTYDSLDRKLIELVRRSDGGIESLVQYSYDAFGRLWCTAQRMNRAAYASFPGSADACTLGPQGSDGPDRITRNSYDQAGRLISVEKAVGTPLTQFYASYGYSDNGKQTSLTDARGYRAEMTFDGFDRQSRWYLPSMTAIRTASTTDYEEYSYDASANRTAVRRRDGRIIRTAYDGLDRVIRKTVDPVSADGCAPIPPTPPAVAPPCLTGAQRKQVLYGYDLRGLQLYASFATSDGPGRGIANTYDGFGRLSSTSNSMGDSTRTLSYLYDADGNRIRITHPDGQYFTTQYDQLDRPTRTLQADGTVVNVESYDDNGKPGGRFNKLDVITYDTAARPQTLELRLAETDNKLTTTFGYAPSGQLSSVAKANTADKYAYTGYVNVNRTYTANGLNQYTAAGTASFSYDATGNLISDGTTTFYYDAENRLIGTDGGASLVYDPLGRLSRVGRPGGGGTEFLYDGDQLAVEYNGPGAVIARYLHGPSDDDPMVWYAGSDLSQRRLLHADERGSIVAVTDGTGAAATINGYDEYGVPNNVDDGAGNRVFTNLGRFQYTGQAWLSELGMYYYKARMYSPTLGRFMQTDPIGYDDQVNLYAYVANDPVNGTDPTGMMCTGTNIAGCDGGLAPGASGTSTGSVTGNGSFNASANATPPGQKQGNVGRGGDGRSLGSSDNGGPSTVLGDLKERGSNAWDNWQKGKRGEDQARQILRKEGYVILGEQVYIRTSQGLRITDFVTSRAGRIEGWEAKTGLFAVRSEEQIRKDNIIERSGGTIQSRGALAGGLSYGQRVQFSTGVISILDFGE